MIMGFGPMPSFAAYLFVNPRGQLRHWDNFVIVPSVSAETTLLVDIDGDGHPELVMSQDDRIGYAKPDPPTSGPSHGRFFRYRTKAAGDRTALELET